MTRALLGRGALAGVVAGMVLAVGLPGTAGAHVSVRGDATRGGFTRVAFSVPNESADASTVKLEVFLPEATPLAFVSTMQVPGWAMSVQRRKLDKPISAGHGEVSEVVSSITWTAMTPANAIGPDGFLEFPVSLGPVPDVDRLVFKALQTYSDGEVVRWIEEPGADGKEPEHPAPTLTVKSAATPSTVDGDGEGSGPALGLAVAGLVAGLGGLVLGGLAFARARSRA